MTHKNLRIPSHIDTVWDWKKHVCINTQTYKYTQTTRKVEKGRGEKGTKKKTQFRDGHRFFSTTFYLNSVLQSAKQVFENKNKRCIMCGSFLSFIFCCKILIIFYYFLQSGQNIDVDGLHRTKRKKHLHTFFAS